MKIRITVEQITSTVNAEDSGVAGEYLLEMQDSIPASELYGAAMDAFSVNVGVSNPEHFEFTVEIEPAEEDAGTTYTRDNLCLGVTRIPG